VRVRDRIVVRVSSAPPLAGRRRVTFNPYRAGTFTCDGEPVQEAAEVIFADGAGWVLPGALRITRGLRAFTRAGTAAA
jgi:hypothetical protein